MLRLSEDDYSEIEIADPNLLREFAGDKLGLIDVKLRTKNRKTIHIEIQLSATPQIRERIIYYDAKLITEQIGSGDQHDVIKNVISILIIDEKLIPEDPKYHHRFTLYDSDTGIEFSDLLEINTLELVKLPKSVYSLVGGAETRQRRKIGHAVQGSRSHHIVSNSTSRDTMDDLI